MVASVYKCFVQVTLSKIIIDKKFEHTFIISIANSVQISNLDLLFMENLYPLKLTL